MARKSKKAQEQQKQDVGYEGKVTISLLHGNKVYKTIKGKNRGNQELFKFLAYSLINQYEPTLRPKFLKLYYLTAGSEASEKEVTSTATPHAAVRVELGTDQTYGSYADAVFEFLVPYGAIQVGNNQINRLRIFDTETVALGQKDLASVVLDVDTFDISDTKTSILITWRMRIANQR